MPPAKHVEMAPTGMISNSSLTLELTSRSWQENHGAAVTPWYVKTKQASTVSEVLMQSVLLSFIF